MGAAASPTASSLRCNGILGDDLNRLAPELTLYRCFDELIDVEDLQLREQVGRGAFGVVYRGYWRGRQVAVKQLLWANSLTAGVRAGEMPAPWRDFCNEAHIMSELSHPAIVRLYAVVAQPPSMVLEFCAGGALSQFLDDRLVAEVSLSFRRRVALDLAEALHYLHSQTPPVLHRDVRSPNVILTHATDATMNDAVARELTVAKLGDFGLAQHLASTARDTLETWIWMTPETRGNMPLYTTAADTYSFGMVLYNLVTHMMPFADELAANEAWRVEQAVTTRNLRPALIGAACDVTPQLCAVVRDCWQSCRTIDLPLIEF